MKPRSWKRVSSAVSSRPIRIGTHEYQTTSSSECLNAERISGSSQIWRKFPSPTHCRGVSPSQL